MGMNINKVGGVNSIYNSQKVEPKKGVQGAANAGKKDEVQISKEAMDFQTVMKAVKAAQGLPDIREEVIAPIKEKLDSDQYDVDSSSIAEKLLTRKLNIKV